MLGPVADIIQPHGTYESGTGVSAFADQDFKERLAIGFVLDALK